MGHNLCISKHRADIIWRQQIQTAWLEHQTDVRPFFFSYACLQSGIPWIQLPKNFIRFFFFFVGSYRKTSNFLANPITPVDLGLHPGSFSYWSSKMSFAGSGTSWTNNSMFVRLPSIDLGVSCFCFTFALISIQVNKCETKHMIICTWF